MFNYNYLYTDGKDERGVRLLVVAFKDEVYEVDATNYSSIILYNHLIPHGPT